MSATTSVNAHVCPPAYESCAFQTVCDEKRRKLLVRQLQSAQKMAPAANVAAGLAHDFKNVMTSIRLHADLIGLSLTPDSPRQQSVTYIREAVTHANDLLERLAMLIRPRAAKPTLLNMSGAIEEMSELLRSVAGSAVTIATQADACSPVRIDKVEFQQIVLNCVANAKQAMRNKGTITLRTRRIRLDVDAASGYTPQLRAGDYAELAISDTGPGMKPDVVREAAKAFHGSSRKSGWGLGLSVVHACAARADGAVSIASRKGAGTTISIALPIRQGKKRSLGPRGQCS